MRLLPRPAAALLLALAGCSAAPVAPVPSFSVPAFQAARERGEPILVHVHADWCPTCRAQSPTVFALTREPAFRQLKVFRIDFDRQEVERLALGARQQSTLIVWRKGREIDRSTGVTDPAAIRAMAAEALK